MAVTIKGATTIRGNTTVGFSPASLFAAGEQGVWFDPSDFSTMFQDSAGTTPVTAVEQPVGRILDKSGRGNHATQSTSGNRPVLSARVNLLSATATLSTQSVTTVATTYTLYFTGSGSITLSGTATGTFSAGSNSVSCTAGTLTLTVSGTVTTADLRPTNQGVGLPAYQRVNTSTDYDTTGFPFYLKFDGVDDRLVVSSVPAIAQPFQSFMGIGNYFSGTGVGDANLYRSASIGAVGYRASGGANWSIYAGTVFTSSTAYVAATAVRSDIYNGASSAIRRNGVAYSGDAGTGALTTAGDTLYIAGNLGTPTTFYARVDLYGLIIRGAASTSDQITATENYMNAKTRAY